MAGRTERVNAKDLLDRADGIFFEGDVVRSWVEQLAKRTRGAIESAAGNRYFETEWKSEYQELEDALNALQDAQAKLKIFAEAVKKREGA